MRHFGQYAVGTELEITMTLKSTLGGKILVCGTVVELEANVAKVVTVKVTQQAGIPTVSIILDILAEDDSEWPGKKKAPDSMADGPVVFTVSDLSVKLAESEAEPAE